MASSTDNPITDEWARLIVEAVPTALVMIDAARNIVLVNRGAESLFGYGADEIVGRPIETLVPNRFRANHPAHVAGFLAHPKTGAIGVGRELFGKCKDETEVPIEIGLTPIKTPRGMLTLASIIDIRERKRSKAAHEQLAAIVESSEDAIISKTLAGVVTSWNRAAEELFGFTAADAIGESGLRIVPERLAEEEHRLNDRIRAGERIQTFSTLRRRKDGSEVAVSVSLSPLRGVGGDIVGASSIVRDITEIKQQDAELQRSNAELEQFAYVASHDLQEPLRMVANYTELLAQRYRGKLDAKADKYIFYAVDGARRMQRLVADLLSYSRVGSQGRSLEPVDAGVVLQDVLRSLRPLTDETAATVDFASLPTVMADEVQLGLLLQNLIGNAIKFRCPTPPHILIEATHEAAMWHFSVADNGIGIEPKYADRIFQMFQRLHEVGKYDGSGIGLAIAKRIVERHGGQIWFETQEVGVTFHFTLREAPKGHT